MLASRNAALVVGAAALAAVGAPGARSGDHARFPAAGVPLQALIVRAQPRPNARVVRQLPRFRDDLQFQIVLVLAAKRGPDGETWYRLSLPGRPNGQRGWVPSDDVNVQPVGNRITVHLDERRIEVRRMRDDRLLLQGTVAIGRPGAETPLGRNFYVRSGFVPTDPFFGTYALETSAGSRLTDWPDHGIVGIHGTDRPELLGRAVSHGCIRVDNAVATALRRLAPLGTPIDILR